MLLIALLCLGFLVLFGAKIWMIIVSFRVSVLWGLSCILVPGVSLFFLIRYWDDARQPFFCGLFGLLLVIIPVAMSSDKLSDPKDFTQKFAFLRNLQTAEAPATPAIEQKPESPLMKQERLEKEKAAFVQHAAELKTKYDALQIQWAKLKPGDKAGRAAFDQEAATYQAMRKQVETEKATVEGLGK